MTPSIPPASRIVVAIVSRPFSMPAYLAPPVSRFHHPYASVGARNGSEEGVYPGISAGRRGIGAVGYRSWMPPG